MLISYIGNQEFILLTRHEILFVKNVGFVHEKWHKLVPIADLCMKLCKIGLTFSPENFVKIKL